MDIYRFDFVNFFFWFLLFLRFVVFTRVTRTICQFAMLFNCDRRSCSFDTCSDDIPRFIFYFQFSRSTSTCLLNAREKEMRRNIEAKSQRNGTKREMHFALRFIWCIAVLMPIKINFLQFAIVHLRRCIFPLYASHWNSASSGSYRADRMGDAGDPDMRMRWKNNNPFIYAFGIGN